GLPSCGTRTQQTSSALPISSAATRAMISSPCGSSSTTPSPVSEPATSGCPRELPGTQANLIRLLEATLNNPQHSSQRPTNSRPQPDHATTTSADSHPQFSARNGPPTRAGRRLMQRCRCREVAGVQVVLF